MTAPAPLGDEQAQRLQNVVTLAGALGAAPFGAVVGALASGLHARRTSTSSAWAAALHGAVTGLLAGAVLGAARGRVIGTLAVIAREVRGSTSPRGAVDT